MLGMESRSRTAATLKDGHYLIRERATVVDVAPTSDPWLPPDGLDVTLDNGRTIQLMPHDWVDVICDAREP